MKKIFYVSFSKLAGLFSDTATERNGRDRVDRVEYLSGFGLFLNIKHKDQVSHLRNQRDQNRSENTYLKK